MAVIISSGTSTVSSGTLSEPIVTNTGRVDVLKTGRVTSAVVSSGGQVHGSSGGSERKGTYGSGGRLFVSSAGACQDLTVAGGIVNVLGGSILGGAMSGGNMLVSIGGNASGWVSGISMDSGASMVISNGGAATAPDVSSGFLEVFSGGRVNSAYLSGGNIVLYGAASAASTVVYSGGSMVVQSGGKATGTYCRGGNLQASGSAINNSAYEGQIFVVPGGYVSSSFVYWKGNMTVDSKGSAFMTTVNDMGNFTLWGMRTPQPSAPAA